YEKLLQWLYGAFGYQHTRQRDESAGGVSKLPEYHPCLHPVKSGKPYVGIFRLYRAYSGGRGNTSILHQYVRSVQRLQVPGGRTDDPLYDIVLIRCDFRGGKKQPWTNGVP